MCVAVVVDSKERIPKRYLRAMEDANPHGAGIAWCDGDLIHYRKGLSWKDIDQLQMVLPRPFFMHFRIATHGAKIAELTHPFPLGMQAFSEELVGSAKSVLMHNGTWHDFRRWVPQGIHPDKVSDTQVAAYVAETYEDILSQVSWSNAIMSAAGNGRVNITLRGRWSEFEGNQYSNQLWHRELTPKFTYSHHKSPVALPASAPAFPKLPPTPPRKRGDAAKEAYIRSKLDTDYGVWDGEEFSKGFLPTVTCDACGKETDDICPCTGSVESLNEQCPNNRCLSLDTEEYIENSWLCNSCFTTWDSNMENVWENWDEPNLSGDRPGEHSQINDLIRQQGIQIIATDDD